MYYETERKTIIIIIIMRDVYIFSLFIYNNGLPQEALPAREGN
jgi:hypothetical protein